MDRPLCLTVTVCCSTEGEALRAQEAVGRVQVGLALDGMIVTTTMSYMDLDEEGDGKP